MTIRRLPNAKKRPEPPSLHAMKALLQQFAGHIHDLEERQEQLETLVLRLLKRLAEKG